jgi:hypothetical protein
MNKRIFFAALIGSVALFALAGCSGQSVTTPIGENVAESVGTPESTPDGTFPDPVVGVLPWNDELDHTDDAVGDFPEGLAGRLVDGVRELVALPASDLPPIIVNVSFEPGEILPKQIAVPSNRQIQLVLRNHDQTEHHYHILGMPTVGILWLSKEDDGALSGAPDEDHEAHHPEANLVPFHICTSRSGVCPTGEWIHAHANPADMDMIIFVAETPGSYAVTDPLHPDLSATFTVFDSGSPATVVEAIVIIDDREDIQAGEVVFNTKGCAACHGEDAEGGVGPALAGHTEAQVRAQVRTPVGAMPASDSSVISEEELNHLVGFIVSLGEGDGHVH